MKALFLRKKILSGNRFKEVGWDSVHSTLHSVPRLFQVWATKQVMGIAGTMKFLSHQDGRESLCPCCLSCKETCSHILLCPEIGCTKAFQQSVAGVTSWMAENAMHPDIKAVVTAYAIGRGQVSCLNCAADYLTIIQDFTLPQDKIGWGNLMMGVISSKLISIQESHLWLSAPHQSPERWAIGLITQLLQVTHAQWIYRCLLVHNRTSGTLITLQKTKLLEEIAKQLSMGAENLMKTDKYLLKYNLSDIATTNGKQKEYWLLGQSHASQTRRCMGKNFSRLSLPSSYFVSREFPRQIHSPGRRACPLCGPDCNVALLLLVAYEGSNHG